MGRREYLFGGERFIWDGWIFFREQMDTFESGKALLFKVLLNVRQLCAGKCLLLHKLTVLVQLCAGLWRLLHNLHCRVQLCAENTPQLHKSLPATRNGAERWPF